MVYVDPYWDRFMWQEIETAPKDGTDILAWGHWSIDPYKTMHHTCVKWLDSALFTDTRGRVFIFDIWQPLPPPETEKT